MTSRHAPGRVRWGAVRLLAVGLTVLVAAVTVAPLMGQRAHRADAAPGAVDQAEPQRQPLRVASVSPWVDADGEFQVRFEPDPTAQPDAELSVTVFQALRPSQRDTVRDAVEEILDGDAPGRVLRTMAPRPLSEFGDPAAGTVLSIPIRPSRGDSERVYVPEAGVHPVELVLTSSDGPELWRQIVFLNRLPEVSDPPRGSATEEAGAVPTDVSMIVGVEAPPVLTNEGSVHFSTRTRSQLRAVQTQLAAMDGVPLVLAPAPNVLDGLAQSDEQWALDMLDLLRSRLPGSSVLRRPYVSLDTASLVAAGGAPLVGEETLHGEARMIHHLDVQPHTEVWALDDTITTEALPALAFLGTTLLLADPASLESVERDSSSASPGPSDPDLAAALVGPVPLEGSETISVMTPDERVSSALSLQATDPALRAHDAVTLLMASRYDHAATSRTNGDSPQRGLQSMIVVPPDADADTLSAFANTLTADGPLRASSAPIAPNEVAGVSDDTEPLRLRGRQLTPLGNLVSRSTTLQIQLQSYAGMVEGLDPATRLWTQLLLQASHRDLAPEDRRSMQDAVVADLSHQLAQIHPPLDRRVVLTSERTDLPLRMRNDLPFPVHLTMLSRSPRLDLPAEIPIVLQPGENRINVPVTVRAPGESMLRIDFRSPDGQLTIPGSDIPVRSTAISGVGAALSAVSIAFLLLWWLRSVRRSRREKAAERSSEDAEDSVESDTGSVVGSG